MPSPVCPPLSFPRKLAPSSLPLSSSPTSILFLLSLSLPFSLDSVGRGRPEAQVKSGDWSSALMISFRGHMTELNY